MRLPSAMGGAVRAGYCYAFSVGAQLRLQLRRSTLNQPDNQHNDGDNEQDMNKTSGHMTDKSK